MKNFVGELMRTVSSVVNPDMHAAAPAFTNALQSVDAARDISETCQLRMKANPSLKPEQIPAPDSNVTLKVFGGRSKYLAYDPKAKSNVEIKITHGFIHGHSRYLIDDGTKVLLCHRFEGRSDQLAQGQHRLPFVFDVLKRYTERPQTAGLPKPSDIGGTQGVTESPEAIHDATVKSTAAKPHDVVDSAKHTAKKLSTTDQFIAEYGEDVFTRIGEVIIGDATYDDIILVEKHQRNATNCYGHVIYRRPDGEEVTCNFADGDNNGSEITDYGLDIDAVEETYTVTRFVLDETRLIREGKEASLHIMRLKFQALKAEIEEKERAYNYDMKFSPTLVISQHYLVWLLKHYLTRETQTIKVQ